MSNRDSSAIIDGILRIGALGTVIGVGLTAPNAIRMLDKPLNKLIDHLDANSKAREIKKTMDYMKRQGLIKGDYRHGLQITKKGKKRLLNNAHKVLIVRPDNWDKKWRMVLYDIPEIHKANRDALTRQLRRFGFWQLQKSVWIHPYPCRPEIEITASHHSVDRFITFLEVNYIDNQKLLIDKFKAKGIL